MSRPSRQVCLELWRVETKYACAGVLVRDGIVVEAAPIYRWMSGKSWAEVLGWRRIVDVQLVVGCDKTPHPAKPPGR